MEIKKMEERRDKKRRVFRRKKKIQEVNREEKEEEGKRIVENMKKAKNGIHFWKEVNKKRKGNRQEISEKIKREEWEKHFIEILERRKGKEIEKKEERAREKEEMREERVEGITSEEIERAIKRLKRKKATGEDRIPNEAWIGGEEGMNGLKKVLNKIWNGEGFPEEWRSGIIVPIFRKEIESR